MKEKTILAFGHPLNEFEGTLALTIPFYYFIDLSCAINSNSQIFLPIHVINNLKQILPIWDTAKICRNIVRANQNLSKNIHMVDLQTLADRITVHRILNVVITMVVKSNCNNKLIRNIVLKTNNIVKITDCKNINQLLI